LPRRSGPKELTVARTWAPSFPDSDRNSVGQPAGWKSQPIDAARSCTLALAASPGAAIPLRSPFTSLMKHGTPAAESCSAISWSVLDLPVPVAPAISPWRLAIARGSATRGSLSSSPSCIALPRTTAGSSSA
jgi:hypothetical protein